MKRIIEECWPFFIVLALLCFMILFSGCRSTKPLQVIHDTLYVKNDVYKDRIVHDSVFTDRYHTVYTKGDTIIIHDSVWSGERTVSHDSVYVHDTIFKKSEIPVQVETIKYKVPSLLWAMLLLMSIATALLLWCFYKKFARKCCIKQTSKK